jgi:serine protease inhibitor
MRLVRAAFAAAMLATGGLTSVTAQARPQQVMDVPACTPSLPQASGPISGLSGATRGFGFRLFTTLSAGTNANVFISPTSVELALAMAYDGARGSTQTAMARTLRLKGMKPDVLRQQAAALISTLASADPKARLEIANSLWARAGFPLKQQFVQEVARAFAAKASTLNFASPDAPAAINGWVNCATHGTIPSIIDRIPADVVLYLINAVYFDGQWTNPFDPANTHPHIFTTGSGQQEQVPLMNQEGTFPYYAGSDIQVISLPYGSGRFAMVVVLPKNGVSLAALRKEMSPGNWSSWIAQLRPEYGHVALPRFSIANSFTLNSALRSLGMGIAFDRDRANFTGICQQQCFLSDVRHKTFLKVYEKGTIAAGVTSVGVGTTAIRQTQFQMIVDHPFALGIRDTKSGTLLFLGGINNPMG